MQNGLGAKIDMNACWNDAVALFMANRELVLILAGLFLFLPTLAMGYFVGQPLVAGQTDFTKVAAILSAWAQANWPYLLINMVVGLIGSLAILVVALNPTRPTVGESITMAAILLPTYFIAQLVSGIAISFGLLLICRACI